MSDYIMDLRKIVGHRPLLQAAASIIIENEKGQVLLGRRTDNHQWGYSGGSIELGETVEEAAKRELFEEMGLIADELEMCIRDRWNIFPCKRRNICDINVPAVCCKLVHFQFRTFDVIQYLGYVLQKDLAGFCEYDISATLFE